MIVKRITIIGNSVGLRKRPPMQYPKNKSYGEILEDLLNIKLEDLFLVNNCSLHRATIKDILKKIDFYIRDFPDYYIINIGVVDATTREIPYWFSNLKDHSKDRFKRLTYILNAIHFHIFKRFRPFFVKL